MTVGDRVLGVIATYHPTQDYVYSSDDLEMLGALANQAAIALNNTRTFDGRQTLVEFIQGVTSAPRMRGQRVLGEEQVLELIYEQANRLMNTESMSIALYDEATDVLRFGLAMRKGKRVDVEKEPGWEPRPGLAGRGKTNEIIRTKRPILLSTREEEEEWYAREGRERYIGERRASWLGVPMMIGERVLGVIDVYHLEKEYEYSGDDLAVLQAIANQAAVALDNATLYYDVNQQLERRVEALAALSDIGQTLTSGIRLRQAEVLELIYEQAQKLTGAQDMYIALYDEETGMIRFGLATEHGARVHYDSREADMEKRGRTEEVIFTREPILHRTLDDSEVWYNQPGRQEFIGRVSPSWLGVPMAIGGKVLGVIAIYDWEREHAYDEQDLQVFSSMANQAAIALDNATLYYETNQKLEEANQELERLYEEARSEAIAAKQLATLGTAIAALQHRINNTFNIIVPSVTRLRKRVDMTDETIVQILDIIERNARYTSDIIARIQEPLREVEGQDVDINAVLDEVMSAARERWPGISITPDLDAANPLIRAPIGQVTEVFRNLVDNACRAMNGSGQLVVASRLTDDRISVRVQDTGPGIPLGVQERLFSKPVPSKQPGGGVGLGLWLSRLMLQTIGGDVKIEKADSTGTTMLVQIPQCHGM
jgi:GAF domain-containing protein